MKLCATTLCAAVAFLFATGAPASPPVEVLHVPREDVPDVVGGVAEGVTLPLAEILELAAKADAGGGKSASLAGLGVTSFALEGTAGECLEFSGDLAFANASAQAAALRIGASGIPWTAQAAADGVDVHLVRWRDGMWLVAGPGARGTVRLGFAISPEGHDAWTVPALDVPVRMKLHLGAGIEPVSIDAPSRVTQDGDGMVLDIWPPLRSGTRVALRRSVPLDAPGTLLASVSRVFSADEATLAIDDTVALSGRFAEGARVRLPLPRNVRLLSARTNDDADLLRETDAIVIVPRRKADSLGISVRFVPVDADAPIGSWEIANAVRSDSVALVASETHVPALAAVPPAMVEADAADASTRAWKVWGALPDLRVPLVPAVAPRPPDVSAAVAIEEDGVSADFTIEVPHTVRGSLVFGTPDGWSVIAVAASANGSPVPIAVVARGASRHLVQWQPGGALGTLSVALHRPLALASHGDSVVDLPRLALDPAPLNDEIVVTWPESLDVRTGTIGAMAIMPATELHFRPREIGTNGIALRATADTANASLLVGRRASDVRASVATLLSVEVDRAIVRSSIFWSVRFARQDTFRFVLPAGADGTSVQIDGRGIRESSSHTVPEGEEWTVQTQYGVADSFSVSLEWTMEPSEQGTVVAPAIDVRDVSAQRGWIALEASPSLRLETEARQLAEADPAELPAVPWKTGRRLLNVWRYLRPPYDLRVAPERFVPEVPLRGLVTEAELTTTIAPDGERLTQARYDVMPRRERQFFEIELPEHAELWAVLVDERGEKPATRKDAAGKRTLLVPLPASPSATTVPVRVLYRQTGEALASTTRLDIDGPRVPVPVNRTTWNLNLPPGFEYLAFEGSFGPPVLPREPLATFLRTAYYPEKLLFEEMSLVGVGIGSVVAALAAGIVVLAVRNARRRRADGWNVEDEKPAQVSGAGCMTRAIELFIVVAIIAVLSAIATPNFLEAQVRSKVSRARADMRSMATALEAYYVDNNAFPPQADILWQGSVKYLGAGFSDPYADLRGAPFRYLMGREAFARGLQVGLVSPQSSPQNSWMIYSVGPDARDDGGMLLYDPTNGTVSGGDIVRVRDGDGWAPTYGQRIAAAVGSLSSPPAYDRERSSEMFFSGAPAAVAAAPKMPAESQQAELAEMQRQGVADDRKPGRPYTYDPSNGTVSQGDVWRVKDGPETASVVSFAADQAATAEARPYPDGKTPFAGGIGFPIIEPASPFGMAGGTAQSPFGGTLPARSPRDAGLLSLDVEIPRGGVQRRFEGLFDEARLSIRLLEERRFLRIRFVAQFSVFLLLAMLWMYRRRAFRPAFVLLLGLGLLLPVAGAGPLAGFFNAAVQGCILALVLPLLSFGAARVMRSRALPAAAILVLVAAPAPTSAQDAVRAIVPYDPEAATPLAENPDAFLDRATFEALWNAAHPGEAPALPEGFAAIADLRIEGTLDIERGEIAGTIVVVGLNTGDGPQSVALGLGEATLLPPEGDSKAALSSAGDGYRIVLPAGGATTTALPFRLPCRIVGNGGSLSLTLPDAASGTLDIVLPFANATASLEGARRPVVRSSGSSCIVALPVQAGLQKLSWKSTAAAVGDAGSGSAWQVGATTRVAWSTLAFAQWSVDLAFESTEREASLPAEIALPIDGGIRITGASGESLRGVRVEEGRVVLSFDRTARTDARLSGVVPAPAGETWSIGSVRPATQNLRRHVVRLEMEDAIEVPALDPRAMQRRSPREVPQGRALREFETTDAEWALSADLRPLRPAIEATVDEVASLVPGSPLRASRVVLQPKDSLLRSAAFDLPEDAKVLDVRGPSVARWYQIGSRLDVAFVAATSEAVVVDVVMRETRAGTVSSVVPMRVRGAGRVGSTLAIAAPVDADVVERALNGATPRPPGQVHRELARFAGVSENAASLRMWRVAKRGAFEFELKPVERSALTSVFNRVIVSEGVQSFRAVVRSEPRRGRIDVVRVRVLLSQAESEAARRLDVSGPVRSVETEQVSDREILVTAHLVAPASSAVEIVVSLDQPFDADQVLPQSATVASPLDAERVQSMLLLRRDFEGQFADVDPRAGRAAEARSIAWPEQGFAVRPSDLAFELPADAAGLPVFRVQRHAREQAVRAVVEVLRLRAIVTEDGFERHELEMALQNQSEQFLRVALPAPKKDIDIYEVRVADRVVDATFGHENGREVLLVPLIRTGLLQPELALRVAYTVSNRAPLRSGERRVQALPEVLGGVPVAQSALVLMVPPTWAHSDFEGSLNQVELVDIEVDEALRRARKVEQLSQTLLAVGDADIDGDLDMLVVQQAAQNLGQMQTDLESSLRAAGAKVEAYGREAKKNVAGSEKEEVRARKLDAERGQNLGLARSAQSNVMSNSAAINERVQQRGVVPSQSATTASAPTPAATAEPAIAFPRQGDVFVFRQLQGTGEISFKSSSRASRSTFFDALVVALVALAAGVLAFAGHRLVATPRRRATLVAVAGIACLAFGVARDVGVILLVVGGAMEVMRRVRLRAAEDAAA